MKQKRFLPIVWRLLRRNISIGQLSGYAIANIVGLSVVLIGILFFCDSRHQSQTEDSFFSSDYITLSKRVEGIGLNPTTFSQEDIDNLEQQPWVRRVGKFTSSQFALYASLNMGGRGLSSYMFCESVPNDFFDRLPRDWKWDPRKRFVPLILSRDYLALYNFGFAAPQGLPQVSEDAVGMVPLKLRITGESGDPEYFDAAIVGFSSRLNTIAVPQDFMNWANAKFSPDITPEPSRLIIEIDRLSTSGMNEYISQHNYEIGGDKADSDKVSDFLSIVSSVVTINGVVISLLALFILLLSIFLLLQKSRQTLRNLMLLGYSPREVGRYYETLVTSANLAITIIATGIALCARTFWSKALSDLGLGDASILPMIIAAVIYFAVIAVINIYVIRTHMMKIWHNK